MASRPASPNLVPLFAALADPTRLRLLNLIADSEVCVCYLVEILRQSQPKVSRHLAYLRKAGVARARREGKWMHYRIERPQDRAAASVLDAVLASLRTSPQSQADLAGLIRICLPAQQLVTLKGTPAPTRAIR